VTTLSEREIERVFDELSRLNAKVDGLSVSLAETSGQWLALKEKVNGHDRLDTRVRHTETALARHKVVLSIIAAIALAVATALARHLTDEIVQRAEVHTLTR
jgi:hypothetical protein